MKEAKKICQECTTIIRGRSDKKFCGDSCRNIYNNRKNTETSSLMRRINFALRKNRRILLEFCKASRTRISREQLSLKGFDFKYYTGSYTSKSGKTCYYCYDLAYWFQGGEKIELVQRIKE